MLQAVRNAVPARLQRTLTRIVKCPALAQYAAAYVSLGDKLSPLLDAATDVLSGSLARSATSTGPFLEVERSKISAGYGSSARLKMPEGVGTRAGSRSESSQPQPQGKPAAEQGRAAASGGSRSPDSGPGDGGRSGGGSIMPGFSKLKAMGRSLVSSTGSSAVIANLLDASGIDVGRSASRYGIPHVLRRSCCLALLGSRIRQAHPNSKDSRKGHSCPVSFS